MWQSKKDHTSFVKSFLHHEADSGTKQNPKSHQVNSPEQGPAHWKVQKTKAGEIVQKFFQTSSLEDESVSLKVLGI
jgi:hypothetical protein